MLRLGMLSAILAAACRRAEVTPEAAPWVFPEPEDLPESPQPQDPFETFFGGERIETAEDWESLRRRELLALFDHYLYGVPAEQSEASFAEQKRSPALSGAATLVEWQVSVGAAAPLTLALFLPAGISSPPVLLGLNKCGNASITTDEVVTMTDGWRPEDCSPSRGSEAGGWSVEEVLAAGVALATVHQSDIDPDEPRGPEDDGALQSALQGGEPAWATLSAWSYGLSLAVDVLIASGEIDPSRIGVWGHSRRGKVALLTAARDQRISLVWAHQSGRGGAALSRHLEGETIGAITALYPHWFTPDFAWFHGNEARLPVDQHLLVALSAPRAVLLTDGSEDLWADPEGASLAASLAAPVWQALYGAPPPLWASRPGGHEVLPEDWQRVLSFAAQPWDLEP